MTVSANFPPSKAGKVKSAASAVVSGRFLQIDIEERQPEDSDSLIQKSVEEEKERAQVSGEESEREGEFTRRNRKKGVVF